MSTKLIRLLDSSRWRTLIWFGSIYIVSTTLTRIALAIENSADLLDVWYLLPVSLLSGLLLDVIIGLCLAFLVQLGIVVFPDRWLRSRFGHALLIGKAIIFVYGILYLAVTEWFFFDEFASRFNYVAVDYLFYPHEVFINIWETYPVLEALIVVAILTTLIVWKGRRQLLLSLKTKAPFRCRAGLLAVIASVTALSLLTVGINASRISDNRVLNEITGNGIYSFFYAAMTNELDYEQYYTTTDEKTAHRRLQHLLADSISIFTDAGDQFSIDRLVDNDGLPEYDNIVLIIEESFSFEFSGNLNPSGPDATPRFDSLSRSGLLFTNVYATGNRTVRGIEACLASFPPIPGRSIVKRPGCENLYTLPALLKQLGYNTVFLYGGRSYFDNLRHFAENNGYDRMIDQEDFDNPTFSTIWGVCDEDLLDKGITVFDSLAATGKPFFATMLTVSNHSPYTYPAGRIPFDPEERTRLNVVRYSDYAIGKFIADSKSHAFFDRTLFVFVADHGARVYGAQEVPIESYRIPLLFYCPRLIPSGREVDILCSQLDLAPTVLDLLGIDYVSQFFGRSILATSPEQSRALMSHNRDVALLREGRLAVLGIQQEQSLWQVDVNGSDLERIAPEVDSSLISDAIAYYQTAFSMFVHGQLHPLAQKSLPTASADADH